MKPPLVSVGHRPGATTDRVVARRSSRAHPGASTPRRDQGKVWCCHQLSRGGATTASMDMHLDSRPWTNCSDASLALPSYLADLFRYAARSRMITGIWRVALLT